VFVLRTSVTAARTWRYARVLVLMAPSLEAMGDL
jgi:hypothetical protein